MNVTKGRLNHSDGEAEKFYRDLRLRGVHVQMGRETTGYSRWFERLLAELSFEVWIGDPAEIKAARVKKQKTDRKESPLFLFRSVCIRADLMRRAEPFNTRKVRRQLQDPSGGRSRRLLIVASVVWPIARK